jgi:hypothetical protein
MFKSVAQQLFQLAKNGTIDKDLLLASCLDRLQQIDKEGLKRISLEKGFIKPVVEDIDEDEEFKHLDTRQRIIEKVLRRYDE